MDIGGRGERHIKTATVVFMNWHAPYSWRAGGDQTAEGTETLYYSSICFDGVCLWTGVSSGARAAAVHSGLSSGLSPHVGAGSVTTEALRRRNADGLIHNQASGRKHSDIISSAIVRSSASCLLV